MCVQVFRQTLDSWTIQYRAIKSVLMTSRPEIIDYTRCHNYTLYTLALILFTIDYILYTWSIHKR